MARRIAILLGILLAIASPSRAQSPSADTLYVIDHYDPVRDPNADLLVAERRATAEHKRILVILGGDWCGWCTYLA